MILNIYGTSIYVEEDKIFDKMYRSRPDHQRRTAWMRSNKEKDYINSLKNFKARPFFTERMQQIWGTNGYFFSTLTNVHIKKQKQSELNVKIV